MTQLLKSQLNEKKEKPRPEISRSKGIYLSQLLLSNNYIKLSGKQ